jgi:hypothetical protein
MSSLNADVIRNSTISDNQSNIYRERHGVRLLSRWERYQISVSASFDRKENDGDGMKLDSLASTGIKKTIESGPDGLSRSYSVSGSLLYWISAANRGNTVTMEYSYNNIKESRRRYVTDVTDASGHFTDSVRTFNYSNNHNTQKGAANLNLLLSKGKTYVNLSLALTSSDINRDELFPDRRNYNRRQTALLPSLRMSKYFSTNGMDFVQLSYNSDVVLPSLEQWRDYLDTQNPYQLVAGNPALKQSYIHNITLSANIFGTDFSMFSLIGSLNLVNNKIAAKTTFFTQSTILAGWDGYVAQPQSTLNSFENLDGTLTSDISVSYSKEIKFIKSGVYIYSSFRYIKEPSYIQDNLVITKRYSPAIHLEMNSNFSRMFRMTVGGDTGYDYTENTFGQRDKALYFAGKVTTELHVLKRFVLNTNYSFSGYKGLSRDKTVNRRHVLNALLGFKLFKGRVEMSAAAYDILNKDTGFSRTTVEDYIMNNRSRNYGRYITINLAYRFYKSNSGLKQPKSINLKEGDLRKND